MSQLDGRRIRVGSNGIFVPSIAMIIMPKEEGFIKKNTGELKK